jgi:hypothetical protein
MRYFTKELWRGAQILSDDASFQRWQAAAAEYRDQLDRLRPRLSADAFHFFGAADVHDAELMALEVRDGSRPAPRSALARAWRSSVRDPVSVRLSVLDAEERFLWELRYTAVRRAQIDFPSDDPLFHVAGTGFGDLGYHELTDAGDGFLRHEVLFATGATATFEFREVEVTREPWRPDSPRAPE